MKQKVVLRRETASALVKSRPRRRIATGLLSVFFLFATGCASGFVTVSPQLPEKYEKIGHAEGTACGTILPGVTNGSFIPVMLNDRVERAYQQALDSVPGSKALTNVTMQENWFWWVIGTTRCVTITGEAIR